MMPQGSRGRCYMASSTKSPRANSPAQGLILSNVQPLSVLPVPKGYSRELKKSVPFLIQVSLLYSCFCPVWTSVCPSYSGNNMWFRRGCNPHIFHGLQVKAETLYLEFVTWPICDESILQMRDSFCNSWSSACGPLNY